MAKQPRLCRFQSLGPHGFHDIAYTEWGNPNASRLVFCVHGFTRNARDFDALAESLAGSCHVVCMDAAGRGQSEWLTHKGDYSFGLYLNDAAALLARVTAPAETSRLRRMLGGGEGQARRHVDWVGTSMGGLMGMMLAAKRHSPIRRLVLNDVGPMVPWQALLRMKRAHSGAHAAFATLGEAEAHLREACAPFGPLSDAQWREVTKHSTLRKGGVYVHVLRSGHHNAYARRRRGGRGVWQRISLRLDLWPTYVAIRCPALVLRGAESTLLQKSTAAEMTRRGQGGGGGVRRIGHAPWLMAEDQIKVVRDFLPAERAEARAASPVPGARLVA